MTFEAKPGKPLSFQLDFNLKLLTIASSFKAYMMNI